MGSGGFENLNYLPDVFGLLQIIPGLFPTISVCFGLFSRKIRPRDLTLNWWESDWRWRGSEEEEEQPSRSWNSWDSRAGDWSWQSTSGDYGRDSTLDWNSAGDWSWKELQHGDGEDAADNSKLACKLGCNFPTDEIMPISQGVGHSSSIGCISLLNPRSVRIRMRTRAIGVSHGQRGQSRRRMTKVRQLTLRRSGAFLSTRRSFHNSSARPERLFLVVL